MLALIGMSFELGRSLKEGEVVTKKSVYDEFINQEARAQAELTKAKEILEEARKASERIEKEREETAQVLAEKDQQISALNNALAQKQPSTYVPFSDKDVPSSKSIRMEQPLA